MKIKYNSITR